MDKMAGKKGLMPLWATAILGFVFLILGVYIAVSFFASPYGLWGGIILAIIGVAMMAISSIH